MCYKITQQRKRNINAICQLMLTTTINVREVCKQRHTSTSILMRKTKTGKQNMNRLTKSAFVIQNFVSASPSEGCKAVADTFSIYIPSFMCPYDGADSHRRIGRDKIE